MSEQLQGYGGKHIDDTDASLKSKTGGRFGLNSPVFLTKFAYNANVAKEGQPAREAIEIVVMQGEKAYKHWIGPITQVYVKDPNDSTKTVKTSDFTTPNAIKAYNEQIAQDKGVLTHLLKAAGATPQAIEAAALRATGSFAEYAQNMLSTIPAGMESRPLDIFLEWQMNPSEDQNVTFLQMPKNMKGGYFLVPAQAGNWEEAKDDKGGLVYKNEQGQEHPFTRDKAFMESTKAYQSGPGAKAQPQPGDTPMSGQAGNGAAKQSTWGAAKG